MLSPAVLQVKEAAGLVTALLHRASPHNHLHLLLEGKLVDLVLGPCWCFSAGLWRNQTWWDGQLRARAITLVQSWHTQLEGVEPRPENMLIWIAASFMVYICWRAHLSWRVKWKAHLRTYDKTYILPWPAQSHHDRQIITFVKRQNWMNEQNNRRRKTNDPNTDQQGHGLCHNTGLLPIEWTPVRSLWFYSGVHIHSSWSTVTWRWRLGKIIPLPVLVAH